MGKGPGGRGRALMHWRGSGPQRLRGRSAPSMGAHPVYPAPDGRAAGGHRGGTGDAAGTQRAGTGAGSGTGIGRAAGRTPGLGHGEKTSARRRVGRRRDRRRRRRQRAPGSALARQWAASLSGPADTPHEKRGKWLRPRFSILVTTRTDVVGDDPLVLGCARMNTEAYPPASASSSDVRGDQWTSAAPHPTTSVLPSEACG